MKLRTITEYALSGSDFGPSGNDRSSRHAYNMQPSTTFGGRLKNIATEPTVIPATDDATIPLRLSYAIYNVFQRYWEGQSDPLYALLSRRGGSVDWVTVFATQEEVDRLQEVMLVVLHSENPSERATAESLYYILEVLDGDDDDE